ncbi:hypothetical protein Tco_1319697 [Tanacetum coccineum]
MTSPNKPTSKPSRVAKMSVKPIWRKKLNPCNTSNGLNVNLPTPMPKPLTPHHEPSHENNHPNQTLLNPYIKDTPTSPQVISHPPFLISPFKSHATHTQAPSQGSIKKVEKRGNVGEPSKDKNGRDDNKRTRTRNAFATSANPVGRENMGAWPNCTTCNSYHAPGGPCRTCFNCNRLSHLAKDYRGVPKNENLVNATNPTVRTCYECGSTDHVSLEEGEKEVSDADSSSSDSEDGNGWKENCFRCGESNHSLKNVQKLKRTTIKEHVLEEHWSAMEKIEEERLR